MKTCPDRGRLEQLLNNRLVDTELDELEQHVEGCSPRASARWKS